MKDTYLEALVNSNDIESYSYTSISDTNNRNEDIYYERLTLKFKSGKILYIAPEKDGSLFIYQETKND